MERDIQLESAYKEEQDNIESDDSDGSDNENEDNENTVQTKKRLEQVIKTQQ